MPAETIRAFQEHGRIAATLEQGIEEAEQRLERLVEAGVDYDDVTRTLEGERVEKFRRSFDELLERLVAKRADGFAEATATVGERS